MEINRNTFLDALQRIAMITTRAETTRQSDCFLFFNQKIYAYNGDVVGIARSPLDITGAIPAKLIKDCLTRIDAETITCDIDGDTLKMKAGRRSAKINIAPLSLSIGDLPTPPDMVARTTCFHVLAGAAECCVKDETAPRTAVVEVTPETVTGTDGLQMFHAHKKFIKGQTEPFYVSAAAISSFKNIEISGAAIGKFWLFLRDSSWKGGAVDYALRLRQVSYFAPGVIKEICEAAGTKIEIPKRAVEIIHRVGGVGAQMIQGVLKNNRITISANTAQGSFSESAKIIWDAEPVSFTVRPKPFLRALQNAETATLTENSLIVPRLNGSAVFVLSLNKVTK